jgi:hypothetical protein
VSADPSSGESLHGVAPDTGRMLRVQTVFRVSDEQHGQIVAAKLIDRAHEIANLPECECDVDVSVEWIGPPEDPSGSGSGSGGVAARAHHAER